MFRNKASLYGEDLSTPRPTPKLEDHPLSAVRYCLFNIFAANLHIGGRSSIRNMRTCHAVETETNLSLTYILTYLLISLLLLYYHHHHCYFHSFSEIFLSISFPNLNQKLPV